MTEDATHKADDEQAPGWDAIDDATARLYPGQAPLHYGTLIKWHIGGPDPLDGISVWKRLEPAPHWHFVTYGFSELFTKESEDAATSGYGFELTFRLACDPTEEAPPAWPMNFLQNLARYVFSTGNVFDAGHWMPTNGPIAVDHDTLIDAIAFASDPELPAIDTPHGHVSFLQVVGLTADELQAIRHWKTNELLNVLLPHMPLWITDLSRRSLLDDPDIRRRAAEGTQRDGSSTGFTFVEELRWKSQKRVLRTPVTEITIGATAIEELLTMVPLRLPFGHGYRLVSREGVVIFEASETNNVIEGDDALTLQLADATAQELVRTLQPRAGSYTLPSLDSVRWQIEKSSIVDAKGNLIRTIG